MVDPLYNNNKTEPRDISYTLDVEQLDLNLYRSRNLILPYQLRGVFGGQVIAQALVAVTRCVKPEFTLHSMHAYFTLSVSASAPLLYYVKEGGRVVFVMLCSFQIPESGQPSHHWTMPRVPRPDECEGEIEYLKRMASQPDLTEERRSQLIVWAKIAEMGPVTVKNAGSFVNDLEGRWTFMYWMKAKTTRQHSAAFQKCILGYISDVNFLPVAVNTSRLKRNISDGPSALSTTSSLDHSVMFYQNDFDCSDWLLYVMTSPAAALGRALCTGLLYTQDGALLAVVNQECVLRARPPDKEMPQAKAKM